MAHEELLKPTLHVEALLSTPPSGRHVYTELCTAIVERLRENYEIVKVDQPVDGFNGLKHSHLLRSVTIVDYTGPANNTGYHDIRNIQLDVQVYSLKPDDQASPRRNTLQNSDSEIPKARIVELPNAALKDAWNSLVFDDALPARLLRYIVRMVSMMTQPGLNLSAFNWNRLCLLHGQPGSGKSTLCRALAQKLSIRLGKVFERSFFVEINTNAMLSKYFGESGKIIGAVFERICLMAQDQKTLVVVVMDEVETIAGSRTKAANGNECTDGMRATNQLLTALDRLRPLSNLIVICTSNLIDAIDSAFLDRVDIKQLIPSPSPAAIYNIFRSSLNELVRSSLVSTPASLTQTPAPTPDPRPRATRSRKATAVPPSSSSDPDPWSLVVKPQEIPCFSEMKVKYSDRPSSPAHRVWILAQRCHGLSGRALRRLPILGLAMYTWGGQVTLAEAVSALEAAVEQELLVVNCNQQGEGNGVTTE